MTLKKGNQQNSFLIPLNLLFSVTLYARRFLIFFDAVDFLTLILIHIYTEEMRIMNKKRKKIHAQYSVKEVKKFLILWI